MADEVLRTIADKQSAAVHHLDRLLLRVEAASTQPLADGASVIVDTLKGLIDEARSLRSDVTALAAALGETTGPGGT